MNIPSKIKSIMLAIVAALSVLVGFFQFGRRYQRQDRKVEDMEDYIKTKKRIENVPDSDDRDAALERMRRNGWL